MTPSFMNRRRCATRSTTRRAGRIAALFLVAAACAPPSPRSAAPGAAPSSVPRAALLDPGHPFWGGHAPAVGRIRFETSAGSFVVEVHRDWAPRGADRLYGLALAGFFDDSRFFRVRAGFIAQFGIPGDPKLAAVWRDATLPDDSVRHSNVRGTVSYAMTGPNARTTQLFV